MSDKPKGVKTICVCAFPDCDGWAAAHFAEGMGMWHDHEGKRYDFKPVDVIELPVLKENLTSDQAVEAVEVELDDPLNIGRSRREKIRGALEVLFQPRLKLVSSE